MVRAETARRYWSEPVRAARRGGRYERTAPVASVAGDLAVLVGAVRALRRRRAIFVAFSISSIVLGAAVGAAWEKAAIGALAAAPVALLFLVARAFVFVPDDRRARYASAVLRAVDVEPDEPVTVRLHLGATQRRPNVEAAGARAGVSATRYRLKWFELEAHRSNGDRLHLQRTELVFHTAAQEGRRSEQRWAWSFTDEIVVETATSGEPLSNEARARRIAGLGEAARVVSVSGDGRTFELSAEGDAIWVVPPDGERAPPRSVDAVGVTRALVSHLAELAGTAAPIATVPRAPLEEVRCAALDSRSWAKLLLAASTPLAVMAGVFASDWLDRRELDPHSHAAAFSLSRAAPLTVVTLLAWAIVAILWVFPPRRGRREGALGAAAPALRRVGPYR